MSDIINKLSRVLAAPSKSGISRRKRQTANQGRKSSARRAIGRSVALTRLRRPRTVSNPSWGRSLPAAYASHVRPRFNVFSRSATSAKVSGCDLVYPIPETIAADGANIFALIPCNPAYWTGTRIAQFAPAYMNYRPLSLTFSYIPQVAVTQAGTVFMGTIWNGAAPSTNIQQTLVTSNGGCLSQCYVPCDTTINLGSNLQQNLFTLSGSLNPDTSPFLFLAGIRGASIVPGYFYVSYTYEFKNPIGQAWDYGRSAVLTGTQIPAISAHPNSSLVLLSQSGDYGPGTIFDLESDGVYYQGSPVLISPSAYVINFYNEQQLSQNPQSLVVSGIEVAKDGIGTLYALSDFDYYPLGSVVPEGQRLEFYQAQGDDRFFFRVISQSYTSTNTGTWAKYLPEPTTPFEVQFKTKSGINYLNLGVAQASADILLSFSGSVIQLSPTRD